MSDQATVALLNDLHVLHKRSLARYLSYAEPWAGTTEHQKVETLRQISDAQATMSDRLGEAILDRHSDVHPGEFPLLYADWHDLSFDYLLSKVVTDQRKLVSAIGEAQERLSGDPLAAALAAEALGEAKGHLESLEELTRPATAAS